MNPQASKQNSDSKNLTTVGTTDQVADISMRTKPPAVPAITQSWSAPAAEVPIAFDVDVVVVGGGLAGVIAAIAAAREGARTVVVEKFATLGGNLGPGMFAGGALHLALQNPEAFPHGLGGIPAEFNRRIVAGEDRSVGGDYFRDQHAVSYVAAKMLEEAGVEVLFNSFLAGPMLDRQLLRGVLVATKSGLLAVRGRVVIDCTGEADVAHVASAPVMALEKNPAIGVWFAIADVDWPRYESSVKSAPLRRLRAR